LALGKGERKIGLHIFLHNAGEKEGDRFLSGRSLPLSSSKTGEKNSSKGEGRWGGELSQCDHQEKDRRLHVYQGGRERRFFIIVKNGRGPLSCKGINGHKKEKEILLLLPGKHHLQEREKKGPLSRGDERGRPSCPSKEKRTFLLPSGGGKPQAVLLFEEEAFPKGGSEYR